MSDELPMESAKEDAAHLAEQDGLGRYDPSRLAKDQSSAERILTVYLSHKVCDPVLLYALQEILEVEFLGDDECHLREETTCEWKLCLTDDRSHTPA